MLTSISLASLIAYVMAAMTAWIPLKEHALFEDPSVTSARYASIASDISDVSLDPSEPPLFAGDDGRVKTALLIASMASFEGSFSARVDDGRQLGDHGTAFCLMQIRPAAGLILVGQTYSYWASNSSDWRRDHLDERISGKDLISDRKTCLRMGLHMMRDSYMSAHHLGWYTGEGRDGPKAKARLGRAISWYRDHRLPTAAPPVDPM